MVPLDMATRPIPALPTVIGPVNCPPDIQTVPVAFIALPTNVPALTVVVPPNMVNVPDEPASSPIDSSCKRIMPPELVKLPRPCSPKRVKALVAKSEPPLVTRADPSQMKKPKPVNEAVGKLVIANSAKGPTTTVPIPPPTINGPLAATEPATSVNVPLPPAKLPTSRPCDAHTPLETIICPGPALPTRVTLPVASMLPPVIHTVPVAPGELPTNM